ncbi:MAG: hypothetical protein IJV45_00790 [Prevotella sp.]|nr:hypothetical protein [Prevotella sp.]
MKTITSKLAALLLLFMGAVAANAETKVYLDDITLAAGEEAVVGINLDNADDPNILSIVLNIQLPEGLEMVVNEDGDYFTATERLTKYHSLQGIYRSDLGAYRMMLLSTSKAKVKNIEGTSAVATFTVKANEKLVDSTIKLTDVVITKQATGYPEIYQEDTESKVTVAYRLDGDVMFYTENAEQKVNPGETFTVEVSISNTASLASMECYVNLPECLQIVENEDGLLFDLPEDLAGIFNMWIGEGQADQGIYYFTLSSMTNELLPEEGVVFSFNVKAAADMPESAEILIDKFLVGTKVGARGYALDDEIKISVSNAVATGIDAAKASVAGAEYFTVGGQRVAAPQKGINVVKMANGEVKKIRF